MRNTISDMIRACEENYGLEVSDNNRNKYVGFLERQLKSHPEYDLNLRTPHPNKKIFSYLNLMRDKLLLFSYLIGETSIVAGYKGHTEERRVRSIDDLYLLRPSELGGTIGGDLEGIERSRKMALRQTDRNLLSLYWLFRINHSNYKHFWPSWGNMIDELGKDKEVIKYFKQKITYKMVKKCKSPNPLTFNHGGDRRSRRFKELKLSIINA